MLEPLLKYAGAIALGYAAGRLAKKRPPQWVYTPLVAALVFFVSANASSVVLGNLGLFLAVSLAYAAALVLTAAAVGSLLDRSTSYEAVGRPAISLYAVAAMALGLAVGYYASLDYGAAIDPLLVILLLVAGADMAGVKIRLERGALAAPAVSLVAATVVAPLFTAAFKITPAVAFGLGWYSFTGPYLAGAGDAVGGAYGLLVNFFREQLTFVLAPLLARRFGRVGVLAAGGATTMDNTLPLYVALYGPSFSIYAFANGVLLTLLVPIVVPAVHQLYVA